ncbi:hypothetical protein KI440_01805 [Candidatus Saccharibacteria bacterium TM7i]|nr:hypothetical protein KI440_01805 [Candidatus Saccharibacteria bacterium TM7i]
MPITELPVTGGMTRREKWKAMSPGQRVRTAISLTAGMLFVLCMAASSVFERNK